jgi:hypothetical protein
MGTDRDLKHRADGQPLGPCPFGCLGKMILPWYRLSPGMVYSYDYSFLMDSWN